ncbi:MAG TPA: hypothetical protein VJY39_11400 [Acidisphaera sp.]|nr:hypothetical protein [Acidisphaera sp.]HME28124.1 hypothetical protein [Acetobacteraceae bacterium]
MTDQKTADATKTPAPDVKSDELSETEIANVTGAGTHSAGGGGGGGAGKANAITLIE